MSTTLIVILTFLTIPFPVSGQTKKSASDPPQLPSKSGGTSGPSTNNERDYPGRKESIGIAYSNYDRDPGKIDATDRTLLSNTRLRGFGRSFVPFALLNDSNQYDSSRRYAILGVSDSVDQPNILENDKLNGSLGTLRVRFTFRLGGATDSDSSVTLSDSNLESNERIGRFSTMARFATVLENCGQNLHEIPFQLSYACPELPNSSITTSAINGPTNERLSLADEFTIRGYNVRSISPVLLTTSFPFHSIDSPQTATQGDKTYVVPTGIVTSEVIGSLGRPSLRSNTTKFQMSGRIAEGFALGERISKAASNNTVSPTTSWFNSIGSRQTTTQIGSRYVAPTGLATSEVIGSFTPSPPENTRVNVGGIDDSYVTSANYEDAANYYYSEGKYKEALSSYSQALVIMRELRDQAGRARILMNVGVVHRAMGESEKALDSFRNAALANISAGKGDEAPLLLYNIALVNLDLGEATRALSNFDRVVSHTSRSETFGVQKNILRGLALNGMGSVYASLGDNTEALSHFNQALKLLRQWQNRNDEATTLNNIGKVHNALGDYVNALDYLKEALLIRDRLGDRRGQADTLYDIGNVYFNLGKSEEAATNYQRSLTLFKAISDRSGESLSRRGLGRVYALSSEQYPLALDYYNTSIEIAETLNNRRSIAATSTEMGRLYKNLGERQKALASFSRALALTRELLDKTSEAVELYEMALLTRDLNDLDQARGLIEAAVEIVESQRAKVPGTELRSTYSASMQDYYELYIDLLVSSHTKRPLDGFDAKALEASERARARSLLDLLAETRMNSRNGVDFSLLERERSAQQSLNSAMGKQARLLDVPHTEEEKNAIAKEVELSIREYQNIESTIRSQSPRYEALGTAQPLTLKEIQTQILDENTLLLSYVLSNKRSFLFAVSSNSLDLYILPKRAEIESEARKVYELLANRPRVFDNKTRGSGEIDLRKLEAGFQEAKFEAIFQEANHQLSQMLLAPVAQKLGRKRLLIVTEGALQKVPFAALPVQDGSSPNNADEKPLVVDHEIVNLPSASVLEKLRKDAASRQAPPKTIAIFADPVFTVSDARMKRAGSGQNQTVNVDEAKYNFDRLIYSQWEADQIATIVPQSFLATGFAANRENATSPKLSQYRIVHFATHGTINEEHPELSSIVLSLFNEQGEAQNGFLRLSEIYDMNLPVDLVVLSGCRTGLGKERPGEGFRSVTQGFMYAGASRVVFSLWAVDDRVTAELMVRFYRKMLGKSLPAAAALREAQVEMWKDDRFSSPYFWAPFVLQGEFR